MSSCPHPDRLLRLHSGDLPEIEQTELVAHLDCCPDCRALSTGWRPGAVSGTTWRCFARPTRPSHMRMVPAHRVGSDGR